MFIGRIFERALSHHVVAMLHVVALIATVNRTSKPVMSPLGNAFRMEGVLSKNHGLIVVKAQRRNIEEHFRFRY